MMADLKVVVAPPFSGKTTYTSAAGGGGAGGVYDIDAVWDAHAPAAVKRRVRELMAALNTRRLSRDESAELEDGFGGFTARWLSANAPPGSVVLVHNPSQAPALGPIAAYVVTEEREYAARARASDDARRVAYGERSRAETIAHAKRAGEAGARVFPDVASAVAAVAGARSSG